MIKNLGHFKVYDKQFGIPDVVYYKNADGVDFYDLQGDAALSAYQQFYAVDPANNLVSSFFDTIDGVIPDDKIVLASTNKQTLYLNQLIYYDADANEIKIGDDKETALQTMLNTLPVASTKSVNELLAIEYKHIRTSAVGRRVDGAVVGVQVAGIEEHIDETPFAAEIGKFVLAATAVGIPTIHTLVAGEGLDKDHATDLLVENDSLQSLLVGTTKNYVWSSMTPKLWANRQWSLIKAARERKATADVAYMGTTFQADDHSRLNVLEMVTAIDGGWQLPANFVWRDAANVDVAMTSDALHQLANLMAAQKNDAYQKSWEYKGVLDDILNSDDADDDKISAITETANSFLQ